MLEKKQPPMQNTTLELSKKKHLGNWVWSAVAAAESFSLGRIVVSVYDSHSFGLRLQDDSGGTDVDDRVDLVRASLPHTLHQDGVNDLHEIYRRIPAI